MYVHDLNELNKKLIVINGNNFSDLESFYDEIDRLFTKNLGWETGYNFNAVNDLLRGVFGVFEYDEPIKLIWENIAKSKLEFNATKKWYEQKISENNYANQQFFKL